MEFEVGCSVTVKGVEFDYKRFDLPGVIIGKVPFEQHYYRVLVNGVVRVVNDSMMTIN